MHGGLKELNVSSKPFVIQVHDVHNAIAIVASVDNRVAIRTKQDFFELEVKIRSQF